MEWRQRIGADKRMGAAVIRLSVFYPLRQIDALVCGELYGLTEEEIGIVEGRLNHE